MTVRVKGLDEFRRELNKVDKRMGKAFGQANKKIGDKVVSVAEPKVSALRSPASSKAGGLSSSAKQRAAVVAIKNDRSNPTTFASVFGTLSHMGGWPVTRSGRRSGYPRHYPGSGPWQPWLGNSWSPEELYGVGPAIRQVADGFALEEYLDAVMDALKYAFPD